MLRQWSTSRGIGNHDRVPLESSNLKPGLVVLLHHVTTLNLYSITCNRFPRGIPERFIRHRILIRQIPFELNKLIHNQLSSLTIYTRRNHPDIVPNCDLIESLIHYLLSPTPDLVIHKHILVDFILAREIEMLHKV